MIKVIPEWLQEAIDFLNQKFPEDRDVRMTVLYGYDSVSGEKDRCGFAAYNTDTESIHLADFTEIKKTYDLYFDEAIETTLMNLFHEYRHHQQNIYNLDMDEEDAEKFAEQMKNKFMIWRARCENFRND
jgi:hypothetical protein